MTKPGSSLRKEWSWLVMVTSVLRPGTGPQGQDSSLPRWVRPVRPERRKPDKKGVWRRELLANVAAARDVRRDDNIDPKSRDVDGRRLVHDFVDLRDDHPIVESCRFDDGRRVLGVGPV
jgi:hypothetical protein